MAIGSTHDNDSIRTVVMSDIIRVYRLTAGYTQAAFARLLGVSSSTIWCWEQRRKIPSMRYCIKLASMMCMSIDELLGYERSAYTQTLAVLNVIRSDGSIDEERAIIINTIIDAVVLHKTESKDAIPE